MEIPELAYENICNLKVDKLFNPESKSFHIAKERQELYDKFILVFMRPYLELNKTIKSEELTKAWIFYRRCLELKKLYSTLNEKQLDFCLNFKCPLPEPIIDDNNITKCNEFGLHYTQIFYTLSSIQHVTNNDYQFYTNVLKEFNDPMIWYKRNNLSFNLPDFVNEKLEKLKHYSLLVDNKLFDPILSL